MSLLRLNEEAGYDMNISVLKSHRTADVIVTGVLSVVVHVTIGHVELPRADGATLG